MSEKPKKYVPRILTEDDFSINAVNHGSVVRYNLESKYTSTDREEMLDMINQIIKGLGVAKKLEIMLKDLDIDHIIKIIEIIENNVGLLKNSITSLDELKKVANLN